MMKSLWMAGVAAAIGIVSQPAAAQTQGVSKTEIVIGSLQDLSGPITALGTHFRNSLQMRFDEANEAGGIHGRKFKLIVEDTGYDPKKAVLAAQKLIQKDKVFAVTSNLGSVVVNSTMQTFLDKGVPHLFPAAPQPSTYEPLHKLKFSITPSYAVTTPVGIRYLIQRDGYKRVGLLYQDDDMGYDVMKGYDAVLAESGLQPCEKVSYKRGATDFSSQIAKLKAANCDFIVLGTVVRETIGAYAESRKIGWNVPMIVTVAGYTAQIHQLGGKAMEGLYAVHFMPHPYAEGANSQLAQWIDSYKKRFNLEPNTWAALGYVSADLVVKAVEKAGPNLTTDSFVKALESVETTRNYFSGPPYKFSATDHLANRMVRVAQIRNGKWENLTDYMAAK